MFPVPIYDASKTPFLFEREDFIGLPSLPLYKRSGRVADLPVDSIVSVFFSMSSYTPKKNSGSSSSGASSMSMNIQFVVYYGTIPRDD